MFTKELAAIIGVAIAARITSWFASASTKAEVIESQNLRLEAIEKRLLENQERLKRHSWILRSNNLLPENGTQ